MGFAHRVRACFGKNGKVGKKAAHVLKERIVGLSRVNDYIKSIDLPHSLTRVLQAATTV